MSVTARKSLDLLDRSDVTHTHTHSKLTLGLGLCLVAYSERHMVSISCPMLRPDLAEQCVSTADVTHTQGFCSDSSLYKITDFST